MPDAAPLPKPARAAREGFLLLAALILLVPVGKTVVLDTIDPDCFIHLHIADQLARDGIGPIVDEHSYMATKDPWTPYSWLAELGMKAVWDSFGYRGSVAVQAVMGAAFVGLVLLACLARLRESADRALNAAIATGFATYLSIGYLSFRPATAALVLMAVCVWLLVRDRATGERSRAAWLVVPLTALLANVHLYAVIVPAWLAALGTGAVWEWWRAAAPDRTEARRRVARYAAMTILSALACLATPMLPGAVRSALYYQQTDAMVAGGLVREFQPFYRGTAGAAAATLVAATLAVVAVRWRALRAGEVLLLLGSLVLLLRMGRFAPVFAMAAAPVLAAALPRLPDAVLGRTPVRLALMALLGVGLYFTVAALPRPGTTLDAWMNRNGPMAHGYPAGAASFVESYVPRRTGRLINEYNWGGYLGWRLAPRFQVLMDGRAHLFTPAFWRAAYLGTPEETAALLASIDADAAVLPLGSDRFGPILEGRGWTRAYYDGRAMVLVPPGTVIDLPGIPF